MKLLPLGLALIMALASIGVTGMASEDNKKTHQRKHTEIYVLNDVRVSKGDFGKFLNSLRDRSGETCEKTRDGGTTYFDASDDRSNRYRISHQVSYSRDNAGEVK